jgi:hypothetical protein
LKEWNTHPANRGNKNQLYLAPTQSSAAPSSSFTLNVDHSTDSDAHSIVVDNVSTSCPGGELLTRPTANEGHYLGTPVQTSIQRCDSTSSTLPTASSNPHFIDTFDFRAAQSCSSTLNNPRYPATCYPPESVVSSLVHFPDLASAALTLQNHGHHYQTASADILGSLNHPARFSQLACTLRPPSDAPIHHAPAVSAVPSRNGGHQAAPPGSGQKHGGGSWTAGQNSGKLFIYLT